MLLVTTAEEKSWGDIKETLFLGEWCLHNYRKKTNPVKNFRVCKPYGLEKDQLIYDAYEKNYLYKNLLIDISDQLNNIHNVSHSLRYWEIIVGPWLNSYLLVIANRYKTLINAFKNYNITKTIHLIDNKFSFSNYSFIDTRKSIFSDLWNNNIYIDIIKNSPSFNIKIYEKEFKNDNIIFFNDSDDNKIKKSY